MSMLARPTQTPPGPAKSNSTTGANPGVVGTVASLAVTKSLAVPGEGRAASIRE